MTELTRRHFIFSAAGLALTAAPKTALSASQNYMIDTYHYQPDDVYAQIGHRRVNMDIGLLHPQDGAPTLGFYAALDTEHGEPFGDHWKKTYKRLFGAFSVHSKDKGRMALIANHIRAHAVTVEQLANAYNIAKSTWDQSPNLRTAGLDRLDRDLVFG